LNYYRYSIIENDTSVILSNRMLTQVDFVWKKGSSLPGYLTMNFGLQNTLGKKVILKVYRTDEPNNITTVIIYNKPIKPAQLLKTALVTLNEGKLIKYNGLTFNKYKGAIIKNGTTITNNRKNVAVMLRMKKTDLDFIYHIYVIYKGEDGKRITFQTNEWSYNTVNGDPSYNINYDYLKQPGDYEILISPGKRTIEQLKEVEAKSAKFSLKVLPTPTTYTGKEVLIAILIIVAVSGLIIAGSIYLVRKRSKARLGLAALQADVARSELNMVRSNLNPHFVFNSLSGIQSLINKNEVERANNYLSKFAGLTRHVLNDSATISIQEEINLLNDYLAMEQLRFPFEYRIDADEDVNCNIEIPVILVQPFVENAVKHGVMPLKGTGNINIHFSKLDKDLKILLTDNGKGFDTDKSHSGLGLKLSKKRIDLLNRTYRECPIKLDISATGSKTSVIIVLTQWL
jgi:two-component system LytT family sensor kinase